MYGSDMRRQFAVASTPLELEDLNSFRLGDWWLYFGTEARFQIGPHVCLIGLAADIETAEPAEIARLEESYAQGGLDRLVAYSDQLVGRFLVLVEHGRRLSVIPDGWASLQAFWANSNAETSLLSSSPGLLQRLGFGSAANCDQSRVRNPARARALEYRSAGALCPVSGARRVRSNHVLELSTGHESRLTLTAREATFETLTFELGRAISGLTLAHGGESWLPITAGVDSRWLAMAASRAGARVKLFTFTPDDASTPDSSIGAIIAARLQADHTPIALPATVSQSVRDEITAVRGAWRDLPKMAELEYLSALDDRVLVLNGNGGEIVRGGYYGEGVRPTSQRLLRALCLGANPSIFDREGFDSWYESVASTARAQGVDLDELYYWEQRMSNWGSDFYAEKDNYADELSPFCARKILRTGPALARRKNRVHVEEELASQTQFEGVEVNQHDRRGPVQRNAYAKSLVHLFRELVPGLTRGPEDVEPKTGALDPQVVPASPPIKNSPLRT